MIERPEWYRMVIRRMVESPGGGHRRTAGPRKAPRLPQAWPAAYDTAGSGLGLLISGLWLVSMELGVDSTRFLGP
jgi:hypothetical protein